jgi:hypothetical protein
MQPERSEGTGVGVTEDAEDAALFVEVVGIGGQRGQVVHSDRPWRSRRLQLPLFWMS